MQQITKLRKSGKLDEAYHLASKMLKDEPDNVWNRRGMSWVLFDLNKKAAESCDKATFDKTIQELVTLDILDEPDSYLPGSLVWNYIRMLGAVMREGGKDPDLSYFNVLMGQALELAYPKSSKQHSALLATYLRAKDYTDIIPFLQQWGLENIRPEDCYHDKYQGRTMPSLAERAVYAAAKHLLQSAVRQFPNELAEIDRDGVGYFLEATEDFNASASHLLWLPYYRVKLAMLLDKDRQQALAEAIPFVRQKPNEFWAWQLLGELYQGQAELQRSCYCRALLCSGPEKFKVKIHRQLASIFMSLEQPSHARTELDKVISIRQNEGWGVPRDIIDIQGDAWYTSAPVIDEMRLEYRNYAKDADAVLLRGIEPVIAIVTGFDRKRKVIYALLEDRSAVSFRLQDHNISSAKGTLIDIWLDPKDTATNDRGHSVLFAAPSESNNPPDTISKKHTGSIKLIVNRNNETIGFADDIYIPPDLIKKHSIHLEKGRGHYTIKAFASYNILKEHWGWRAFDIEKRT